MLDERSPVPLYYQLQEIIRNRIESGQWGLGHQLPPEADLCTEFNLSRGTVRQALADLVREGKLHRRRGKGSFVAAPKIQQDLQTLGGFTDYVKNVLGTELGCRLISVKSIPATASAAKSLGVPEGSELVEVRKVKVIDDKPFFMATNLVSKSLCPDLDQADHSSGSVITVLRDKYNLEAKKARGWFEPVLVSEYEASLLNVDRGSPAMMYERVRFSADDQPLMLSKNIVRGDMCRITFQVGDADKD